MQFKTVFALAPLALAAPLESRQDASPFTVTATHSASPVHLTSWTIRNGGVFLSGNSSTYCPEGAAVNCDSYGNISSFGAQTGSNVGLGLNTGVPGGQLAFVASNGALGYTQAHSASMPEGALTTGFSFQPPQGDSQFGTLGFSGNGATGFVACQVNGEYQVFANVAGQDFSQCIGTNALTNAYSGAPAWQYTG